MSNARSRLGLPEPSQSSSSPQSTPTETQGVEEVVGFGPQKSYKLRRGDTLFEIAQSSLPPGTPKRKVMELVNTIAQQNKLQDPNRITAGEQLNVPMVFTPSKRRLLGNLVSSTDLPEEPRTGVKQYETPAGPNLPTMYDKLQAAIGGLRAEKDRLPQSPLVPSIEDYGKGMQHVGSALGIGALAPLSVPQGLSPRPFSESSVPTQPRWKYDPNDPSLNMPPETPVAPPRAPSVENTTTVNGRPPGLKIPDTKISDTHIPMPAAQQGAPMGRTVMDRGVPPALQNFSSETTVLPFQSTPIQTRPQWRYNPNDPALQMPPGGFGQTAVNAPTRAMEQNLPFYLQEHTPFSPVPRELTSPKWAGWRRR